MLRRGARALLFQPADLLCSLSDGRSVRCHSEHHAPKAKALRPVAPLFRQHGQGPEGLGPIRPDLRGSKEVLRRLAAAPRPGQQGAERLLRFV